MDTRRLLILPLLALGLAACGSSSVAVAPPAAKGATPTHDGCGVTLEDVQSLAPATVKVSVRNRSGLGPGDCDWYWIDRAGGIGKDPGDVHVSFAADGRKDMEASLETGVYGELRDLPGVGDKAYVSPGPTVQVIALQGDAAVNVQVRNIEGAKATEVATMAAKRSLGG